MPGLRFASGPLAGLGVNGEHDQKAGFDVGEIGEGQFGLHYFLRVDLEERASTSHAVFAGVYGGAGVAVGFAALLGFALVPVLFALGDGQFAFDPAVEIEAGGDERVAFDLRLRSSLRTSSPCSSSFRVRVSSWLAIFPWE